MHHLVRRLLPPGRRRGRRPSRTGRVGGPRRDVVGHRRCVEVGRGRAQQRMEPHLGARRPPETVRRRRRAPLFDTRRRPRPQGRRNSNRRSKGVRHGADACTRGDGTDAASADIDDDRVREGARVLSMGAARAHEGNGRSAVKRRCEEKVFRLVMRAAAYRRASTAALRTAAHCCALLRTAAHCCALLRTAAQRTTSLSCLAAPLKHASPSAHACSRCTHRCALRRAPSP